MIEFRNSFDAAESWKTSVKNLWKTQRLILIFGILSGVLLLTASILLFSGIMAAENISNLSLILIITACVCGFAGVCFAIATYICEWIFYFDLKRWGQCAPLSIAGNIRTLATCTLVTLIAGIVTGFFDSFSVIPYIGIVTSIISALVGLCALVFEIIKFVMIIRMKNAPDMPYMAKRGAANLFYSYIISFVVVIFSIVFICGTAISFFASVFTNSDDTHSEYEYVEEYNYYYEDDYDSDCDVLYEESSNVSLLSGIIGNTFNDIDDEDLEEIEDMFDDAISSLLTVVLFLTGLFVFIFGSIISVIFYYYGWWLISKSELEVLPERVSNDNDESTPIQTYIEQMR